MSSEAYEIAQDELENVLEKLRGGLDQLVGSGGEARKHKMQVLGTLSL